MRLARANATSAISPIEKGSGLISIVVPDTSASARASSSPVGRDWWNAIGTDRYLSTTPVRSVTCIRASSIAAK